MFPIQISSSRRALRASAALALLLAGCGQSIEQNKIFAKQQKTVTQLENENKAIQRHLDELTDTVSKLAKDVQIVRNNPQSASGLEARLNELQKSLAETTLKIADMEKRPAAAPQAARPAPADPTEAQGADETKPAKPAAAPKPDATPKPGPKATPKAARGDDEKPAERKATKGSYYNVKVGDTAEGIAAAHGVSVQELQKANNVRTLQVQPGTKIFIPAK